MLFYPACVLSCVCGAQPTKPAPQKSNTQTKPEVKQQSTTQAKPEVKQVKQEKPPSSTPAVTKSMSPSESELIIVRLKTLERGQGDIKANLSDVDKHTSFLEAELKSLEMKLIEYMENDEMAAASESMLKHLVEHLQVDVRDINGRLDSLQMFMMNRPDTSLVVGDEELVVEDKVSDEDLNMYVSPTPTPTPTPIGDERGPSVASRKSISAKSSIRACSSSKSATDASPSKSAKSVPDTTTSNRSVKLSENSSTDVRKPSTTGRRQSSAPKSNALMEKALDSVQSKIKWLVQDTNREMSGLKNRLMHLESELKNMARETERRESIASLRAVSSQNMNRVSGNIDCVGVWT